jgi:hypothetical protein
MGLCYMSATRKIYFWVICSLSCLAVFNAHAATVSYTLDNVIMHNDYAGYRGSNDLQMTGTFVWTYDSGDFENGTGEFSELFIPWLASSDYDLLTINFDIGGSIEFNRDGTPSTHDEGIDITLFFAPGLTPTGSAQIDLDRSKFDIGGNGFIEGDFTSGSISPVPLNDADGDGVPDDDDFYPNISLDGRLDTDRDGIPDDCDAECILTGMTADADDDGDVYIDSVDNCPLIANPDQLNSDGDGIGNVCDNCPVNTNPGQEDDDGDSIGNVCDPDWVPQGGGC